MAGLLRAAGEASLSAAVMILAVLVLRLRFQDRTPRRVFCLLWDLVLARLLVLGALPSPVSIRRWLPAAGDAASSCQEMVTAAAESVVVTREEWRTVGYLAEDAAQTLRAGITSAPAAVDWGAVLAALWLAAGLLMAAGFLWSHLRGRRVYAAALPCRDGFVLDWLGEHPLRRPVQVRTSGRIAAPLTYGVLYPVILLPGGMDWEDRTALACVLAHEHEHIRRFDALRKALLAAALCLHWYNPLVWGMYVLANRDIELACDEAVLRGGADRERYALALLGMEERRGRWTPTGSHFSGNALEERIKAIMKRKHVSITALAAVLVVMCVTTTVFASAAPEGGNGPKEDQDVLAASFVTPLEEDGVMMMSKGGEDGGLLYSVDGGKNWMSEERYQAQYGGWGDGWEVEWWTYDEYKAWLEQEKKDLQEIIGSKGWTPSTGWFTWDQKRVDETIAMYEGILEDIKNGALHSRLIIDKNGNEVEDVALGSDGPITAYIESWSGDALLEERSVNFDAAAMLEELKAFGITGDGKQLYYNGQLIRRFVDGAPVGNDGYSVQYVYTNDQGAVDVHTLRAVIHHPDGSYDTMGDLTGVAAAGDKDFDPELIEAAAFNRGAQAAAAGIAEKDDVQEQAAVAEGTGERGTSFEEIFARYEAYGLVYLPRESGMGRLTWNGQPVRSFADLKPDGGVFSYTDPYAEDGLALHTEYDRNGELLGLAAEPAPLKDFSRERRELGFQYSAPVQGTLSAGFGQGRNQFHYGVDIAAAKGTDVTAFAAGEVSEVGFNANLGHYVVISHEGGYSTLYAHCGNVTAVEGAGVSMGEKIAEVGSSGMATGAALHFELRWGSTYLDPCQYLDISSAA